MSLKISIKQMHIRGDDGERDRGMVWDPLTGEFVIKNAVNILNLKPAPPPISKTKDPLKNSGGNSELPST